MRYTIQLEAASTEKLKAILDKDPEAIVTIEFPEMERGAGKEDGKAE